MLRTLTSEYEQSRGSEHGTLSGEPPDDICSSVDERKFLGTAFPLFVNGVTA